MTPDEPLPTRLVRDAEVEAAARRESGAYSPEVLKRLEADFRIENERSASAPEALAYIPSARPLEAKGLGALAIPAKRVVRRLLAWYVHPITVDQTRFNTAITRELRSLEERLALLEEERHRGRSPETDRKP